MKGAARRQCLRSSGTPGSSGEAPKPRAGKAFWREDNTTKQSIFALNNVSDQPQEITVAEINLIPEGKWRDLIGHVEVNSEDNVLVLQPYQSVWLTNVWKSKSTNTGEIPDLKVGQTITVEIDGKLALSGKLHTD